MSKKTQPFNVTLSRSQADVITALCEKYQLSKAEFTRLALKAMIQKEYGIAWPDDMPKHGGRRPYPRTDEDN